MKYANIGYKQRCDMHRQTAMTLIELLIAVSVVAILAAVAVPSYQDYSRQARRADAQSVMLKAAQFLERTYTTNNCYDWDGAACGGSAAEVTALLDNTMNRSPSGVADGDRHYIITVTAATTNTFTLRAAPSGAMTGDTCGNLTLTNTGVQGTSSGTVALCWKR